MSYFFALGLFKNYLRGHVLFIVDHSELHFYKHQSMKIHQGI